MSKDKNKLIVHPRALINYQKKVVFKIPPSIYPTQIDIRFLYDKSLRELKAQCCQTSVIQPDRRIRGIAAVLEDQVPVAKANRKNTLVVGKVVPVGEPRPTVSRRAAESAKRKAGRATCRPLKSSQTKQQTSGTARNQPRATGKTSQNKKQEVPAAKKRNSEKAQEPGLLKRLCLGINKEVLKKTNISVVNFNKKKTTLQKVETQTTTRNIVAHGKSGKPVIDKDPKEVHKKVEVSEKTVFNAK